MFTQPTYHHVLAARLRSDPTFAFDFARRFRDLPPTDPEDLTRMALLTVENPIDDPRCISFADVLVGAEIKPDAAPLPGREPWPQRWALLIDVIDDWPPSTVLLRWPLRYATLRAQLGCPVTHIVLVPSFELAIRLNELFAIEPELTPVVVISDALRNEGRWVN
jgi:hypothetical protein